MTMGEQYVKDFRREYKSGVFPRELVVTFDLETANKYYETPDGEEMEIGENVICTVYRANSRETEKGVLLLIVNKIDEFDTGIIAHESLHVVRSMLEPLPCMLNDETEEVWCYMVGWVARCMVDAFVSYRREMSYMG